MTSQQRGIIDIPTCLHFILVSIVQLARKYAHEFKIIYRVHNALEVLSKREKKRRARGKRNTRPKEIRMTLHRQETGVSYKWMIRLYSLGRGGSESVQTKVRLGGAFKSMMGEEVMVGDMPNELLQNGKMS
jgi:hypothetical protein